MANVEKNEDSEFDELQEEFGSDDEDPDAFKVRDALNPPITKLFTTSQLHQMIHEGQIDLDPPYQRGVVWNADKQSHLIDSLFRNFFIPPLVFTIQRDENGGEVRICVDGKQRLTSIQKFLDGQLAHKDSVSKRSYYAVMPDHLKATRHLLPDFWRSQFESKLITCIEYRDLAPGTERDIFQRVQLGVSLTAPEKLQAIDSPTTEWICDLETRFINSEEGISETIKWDTKRARAFQCLAQIIYCCDTANERPMPSEKKLKTFLAQKNHPHQRFKDEITGVMTEFRHIASTPALNFGFRRIEQRVAPVEFLFIGILLYVLREASHETRAKAIFDMRTSIRKKFRDVRANTVVGKAFWDFVGNVARDNDAEMGSPREKGGAKKRKKEEDEPGTSRKRPAPRPASGRSKPGPGAK